MGVVFVHRPGKPAGKRFMPYEVVSPHLHSMRLGEGNEAVWVGKVVSLSGGSKDVPLQAVLRHNDVVLFCQQVAKALILPEQIRVHGASGKQTTGACVDLQRARSIDRLA